MLFPRIQRTSPTTTRGLQRRSRRDCRLLGELLEQRLALALPQTAFGSGDWGWAGALLPDNVVVSSVATDSSGNVYVAGSFSGNPDFDMGPGTAICIGQSAEGFVAKYSASGGFRWVNPIVGPQEQYITGMTVDADGNVLACGLFYGVTTFGTGFSVSGSSSSNGYDGFIMKLDTLGQGQWVKTFTGQYGPHFRAVATDSSGAAIVVGRLQDSTVDFDPGPGSAPITAVNSNSVIVKLNSNGTYAWSAAFQNGEASDVTTDPSGNIGLTGLYGYTVDFDPSPVVADLTSSGACIYVLSLSPTGSYRWARSMPYADNSGSYFDASVAADDTGSVYVSALFTGSRDLDPTSGVDTKSSIGGLWDSYVTKMSSAGDYRWTAVIGGTAEETPSDLVTTPNGGLYLSGWFNDRLRLSVDAGPVELVSAGGNDAFMVTIAPTGAPASSRRYGGSSSDTASGIAIGIGGNVILAGVFNDALSTSPVEFGPVLGSAALVGGDRPSFILSLSNQVPTEVSLSTATISENVVLGADVGSLSATDPDAASTVSYSLVIGTGSADNAAFSIDGDTLRTAAVFDYESKSSYTIRVRATDQGGLSIDKVFTIVVTNVNETPTDITLSATSIAENRATGSAVGILSATDPDAASTVTYALVTGTGSADNAAFSLDGGTLRAAAVFDYESRSSYTIRVRATDQGGLSTDKVFSVAVTNANEAPTDIVLSATTVAENRAAVSAVGTLSATDPDAGNTFMYSLVAGIGSADNAAFSIDGDTLRTAAVFDYESKSSYTIRVRAIDQGGLSTDKVFSIAVTNVNETPTNIALSAATISENVVIGSSISTLSATDPDAASTFAYALVAGTGSADNAAFSLDGDTLRSATVFDYESKSAYSIRVRATDQGGLSTDKVFTIVVTNVNEAPSGIALSVLTVAENLAAGSAVGALSATDPDAASTVSYSLVIGTGSADNAAFSMDGDTLRTAAVFDYESKSYYTIRVRAIDQGGLSTDKVFSISITNVNEAPTHITLSAATVAENRAAGSAVGTLSVTDPDVGNTFTYSLVIGTGSADNAAFSIDGGTVRTAAVFDYESKSSYSIRVRATDQGELSTDKVFWISITNVNEAPTHITLSAATVAENRAAVSAVGTLSVTDPDAGNTFTYSLVAGSGSTDNAAFSIDGDTLRTAAVFDYESKSSYSIRVRATDQGGLSTDKVFSIAVMDVNEPPTGIHLRNAVTSLAENSSAATRIRIADLSVVDDALGNNVITVSGTDAWAFEIAAGSLWIRADVDLNFEATAVLTGVLTVTDSGAIPSGSVSQAFSVSLLDRAEPPTAPVIRMPAAFGAAEDAVSPLVFSLAPFTDADSPLWKAMRATVSVADGTLTAVSATGVTVTGSPQAKTFVGSLAALNAYFTAVPARVSYLARLNANGERKVTITISENYGAKVVKTTATAIIAVAAVNDVPSIWIPKSFTFREDTTGNLVWPKAPAPVVDIDSSALTLTLTVPTGAMTGVSVPGVSVGGTSTARTISGSPAALNAFLTTPGRLQFRPAADDTAPVPITAIVSDGFATRSASTTLTVVPVNDAPTVAAAALIPGSGVGNVVLISHELLLAATKAKDIDSTRCSFIVQWISSGTLERWNGRNWVALVITPSLPGRTIAPGQAVRWTPPAGARGTIPAFRLTVTDGSLMSPTACDVSVVIA